MTGILCGPRGGGGGGTAGAVSVPDDSIVGLRRAAWKLGADGFIYRNGVAGSAWITPQSGMADYEISASLAAGADPLDVDAGQGVWLSPVISPEWGYANAAAKTGELDVEIRRVSDGFIVDSAAISLEITGGDVPPHNRFDIGP